MYSTVSFLGFTDLDDLDDRARAAQSRDASSHVPGFREAEFRVHLSARVTRSQRGKEEGRERSREEGLDERYTLGTSRGEEKRKREREGGSGEERAA